MKRSFGRAEVVRGMKKVSGTVSGYLACALHGSASACAPDPVC